MKLGAFSISLSVKDLATSREFYEKVGFEVFAGGMEQNYLIMKNGDAFGRTFSGHVRREYHHSKPGLGPECPTRGRIRRRTRDPKTSQISRESLWSAKQMNLPPVRRAQSLLIQMGIRF